jgi:CheY-like chemotaxis protein
LLGERIEVQLDLAPDLWTVRADVGQLEHALLNLALNARDAMSHGGALRITTRNEDVQPGPLVDGVLPAGRYAVLELTDNGIGMSEETRSRVFEPFFTTKDPADRSGLGLATVYGIVNQASGRISVASRPGNGTTFTIHLPAAPDFDGDASANGARSRSSSGNVILIAEDNEGVRALTVRVLTSAGYQVVEGCDGVDALETLRARDEPVDLLISDVMMPRMNGAELAARFQRIQPGTPIMLMSGYMDDEAVRRAFEEPDAILPKPFTPDALISRVKDLIGKVSAC